MKLINSRDLRVSPAWSIVWNPVKKLPANTTWQDDGIAIAQASPIFSPDGQLAIVGDAFLTNRIALQQHLPGKSFAEDPQMGDLQLIAGLWQQFGIESVARLCGTFAFAVWDRHQQKLWGVRDRVGAKTLYYNTSGSTVAIAPRLKTLTPYRTDDLDLVALRDYLCCAFVPGERTLWRQVRELRPAEMLCLSREGESRQFYWQPQAKVCHADRPVTWHAGELRSLLEQVVQDNLPSHQPVGAYLSGGLDSSCIVALASQFHDRPVHTYSIHFGADYPNELEFADRVARHCQTQHRVLEITPDRVWEMLPVTMANLDDPIGDPLTVPNYLLGQIAGEEVSTILNGEGGDPCFGGPKNKPMLLDAIYAGVATSTPPDLLSSYLSSYKKCFRELPQLLKPEILGAIASETSVFSPDLHSETDYLNRLMLLNIKFKGADHILTKVNNLTSAAGLSGRSPLFDPRIVELSLQIPPNYKLAGAEEKAVLKSAVADLLPQEIVYRPKSGMRVPVSAWFYRFWRRRAKSLLLSRNAQILTYFDRAVIGDWLEFRGDPWHRYGIKLWLLVSLEMWLQVHRSK
ncbi:MAG: asparagine synthase-related protein [Geitlerinemataceae cyanobacterium]